MSDCEASRSDPGFYFVSPRGGFGIDGDSLRMALLGGLPVAGEEENFAAADLPSRPLNIVKEVSSVANIFSVGQRIVVDETVRAKLTRVCALDFREVRIAVAFRIPKGPLDPRVDRDRAIHKSDRNSTEAIVGRLASAYQCAPPHTQLFEPICQYSARMVPVPVDLVHYEIDDMDDDLLDDNFEASCETIQRCGMTWDVGYHCSSAAWEVLGAKIHLDHFVVRRFSCSQKI